MLLRCPRCGASLCNPNARRLVLEKQRIYRKNRAFLVFRCRTRSHKILQDAGLALPKMQRVHNMPCVSQRATEVSCTSRPNAKLRTQKSRGGGEFDLTTASTNFYLDGTAIFLRSVLINAADVPLLLKRFRQIWAITRVRSDVVCARECLN